VVSSERCQCFSPSSFIDFGIDPTRKHLLVVKSLQLLGAFATLASEVIYTAAPGAAAPDPRQTVYRRVDTTRLYPWSQDPLAT
jgi:microcystin degradation protein MlrC